VVFGIYVQSALGEAEGENFMDVTRLIDSLCEAVRQAPPDYSLTLITCTHGALRSTDEKTSLNRHFWSLPTDISWNEPAIFLRASTQRTEDRVRYDRWIGFTQEGPVCLSARIMSGRPRKVPLKTAPSAAKKFKVMDWEEYVYRATQTPISPEEIVTLLGGLDAALSWLSRGIHQLSEQHNHPRVAALLTLLA